MRLVVYANHVSRLFDIIDGNSISSHRDVNRVHVQCQGRIISIANLF